MPLKLKEPRKGKSPNYSIRGTYLGVAVDKSCGTHKRSFAHVMLKRLEEAIERREYPPAAEVPKISEPTFLSAAVAYMDAGRRRRFVAPLIKHFGETALADIDQQAIERAAAALYPGRTPATHNAAVFTPCSAILRHAGVKIELRRPKGARGRIVTDYLNPDDAFAIIAAAEKFDRELALLLRFLLYTGCRISEALALRWDDADLNGSFARVRQSKNGDPRGMKLREDLCEMLAEHPRRDHDPRIFRFHQGGWLKALLLKAKLMACGLNVTIRPAKGDKRHVPAHRLSWVNFHTFRHTWATWMRRYGGADVQGLVATGNWRDARSAARYAHVLPRDEWDRVERLPWGIVGENRKAHA